MSSDRIRELFQTRFGGEPSLVATAPGRLNLIGEHTDYNGGYVFPAAIDRGLTIAVRLATGGKSTLFSQQMGEGESFDAESVQPSDVDGWSGYAAGMAWALREFGRMPNIDVVLDSTIPIGSGVSSSAALEMAFGVVWRALVGFEAGPTDLAKLGKLCENQFIGVNSGIMDQMASAHGQAGSAMFLDTLSLEIEYASIPDEWVVVLCDTQTPRTLAGSAYNVRRAQCEMACKALGIELLRYADVESLESLKPIVDEVVYKRARHVVTENDRCLAFRGALSSGDKDAVGELMRASHLSLKDDYSVSSRELDIMAESAWHAPGCVGARMTGAGFGGACVAIVERAMQHAFMTETLERYNRAVGSPALAMVCELADGARIVN